MSAILDIVEKLQDTQAAIKQLEDLALKNPISEVVKINLNSLQNREKDLKKAFASLAEENMQDVCSYRLIADEDSRYTVTSLTKVLGDFQNILTIVYDAIKNNTPKQRADIAPEIARESALEFGYAFSGSLGFVFTIPNERLIAVDSDLDLAIQTIFEMTKSQDSKQLSVFAKKVGVAPIRAVFRWAKDHVDSDLSAEIQWERKDEIRSSLLVQPPELERLMTIIGETSEVESQPVSLYGKLVGADTDTRTFHLKVDGEKDIKGPLGEDFKAPENFALDNYYMANMVKRTKIHYSTDKPDIVYSLISLGKFSENTP
jgi:hypothetical protein